jgi:hypothetical protein
VIQGAGMASQFPAEGGLVVRFTPIEGGGLIATCDEVPNFYLSHSNAEAVRADVIPALQVILSAMYGTPMEVRWLPRPDESLGNQMPMPALLGGDQIYQGIPHR